MSRAGELDMAGIKARLWAATPGPWERYESAGGRELLLKRKFWQVGGGPERKGVGLIFGDTEANADLIAHAPADLAALVARVEELEGALREYADPQKWGYIDDGGAHKGHGRYTDACFVGPDIARAALESSAEVEP